MKFKDFIKDFVSKCEHICGKSCTWSRLLKKSLMEKLIFFAVIGMNCVEH